MYYLPKVQSGIIKQKILTVRKITLILLLVLFSFLNTGYVAGQTEENGEETAPLQEPEVSAEAALTMDLETGRILMSQNSNRRKYIASTTKIMTAVIALENGRLSDVVTVSEGAASTGGSSVWLDAGEKKTLEELLYGLMLRSGNDAAIAIAEHIGRTVEEFAVMMTEKAHEIGAKNTVFKNPHGLHHEEHISTAYDLALIAAYALENETFRRIIAAPRAIISWPGHEWDRILHNQNRLLRFYEGADGVKTGWTTPAGRCFVGSATREGRQVITVVLNAPDLWDDTQKLLDYGFNAYTKEKLLSAGQVVKSIDLERARQEHGKVAVKEDFWYPLKPGEQASVRYRFRLEEPYRAPLSEGEKLGDLEVWVNDEQIGLVDLVAAEDIRRQPFYQPLLDLFRN